MELQYYGANCVRITTKKTSLVVDDNLDKLGLKSVTKPTDISLKTFIGSGSHSSHFVADMPGEYEISGVIIHGISARAHMDKDDSKSSVIYRIEADDTRLVVIGHIYPDLSEEQLEQIGSVDVVVIPVGNSGYTLDGQGALSVIKKIEPKIVIPTHYADKTIKYEVPQIELTGSLKDMGMEISETVDKYKIRPGELADSTKVVVLSRIA
jgi:L-ascorbate metabolism protein UlaG (beta-lactamase superfamily)